MPEQVWRTEDGRIFESMVEAEEYENIIKLANLIEDLRQNQDLDDFELAKRLLNSKKVEFTESTNEREFEGI